MKVFKESEKSNNNSLYVNKELKNEFFSYINYGKPNEKKITFGDNPLTIYQNYTELLNKKIVELNSKPNQLKQEDYSKLAELYKEFIPRMNELSASTANLPIFIFPDKAKLSLSLSLKQKQYNNVKKRKQSINNNNNNNNIDSFTCEVCGEEFDTGQGLGGHMSRKHPNSSLKFKKKKETRDKRKEQRDKLYEAKRRLLETKDLEYNELIKTQEGRRMVKETVARNKSEYKQILKSIKAEANGFIGDEEDDCSDSESQTISS
jgi:hypothetical protein